MEGVLMKVCSNCKRDIPVDNYTVHSLHCARNITSCPICKEPVPTVDLDEHNNTYHKIVPCKQCGEGVCGTDMEDHLRDSCAMTLRPCRYCELELPRHKLPGHEQYCGTRTEKCAECNENVMMKYKQLHLESNHKFMKLEDEPGPKPSWEMPVEKTTAIKRPTTSNFTQVQRPPSPSKRRPSNGEHSSNNSGRVSVQPCGSSSPSPCHQAANKKPLGAVKKSANRTNDMPQVNLSQVETKDKVTKELLGNNAYLTKKPLSPTKTGVKKRPAPQPPKSIKNIAVNNNSGRENSRSDAVETTRRSLDLNLQPMSHNEFVHRFNNLNTSADTKNDKNNVKMSNVPNSLNRREPRKQMPPTLNIRRESPSNLPAGTDRFSNIKNELRQLRKGLNEVTAPYNNRSISPPSPRIRRSPPLARARTTSALREAGNRVSTSVHAEMEDDNDRRQMRWKKTNEMEEGNDAPPPLLPCEFCHLLIAANRLVLHQTGCRPEEIPFRKKMTTPYANRAVSPQIGRNFFSQGVCKRPTSAHLNRFKRAPLSQGEETVGHNEHSDAMLPCEFCHLLVAADDLVLHETGCRPEETQFKNKVPKTISDLEFRHPPGLYGFPVMNREEAGADGAWGGTDTVSTQDAYETKIPCEFCMSLFSVSQLMAHQQVCEMD